MGRENIPRSTSSLTMKDMVHNERYKSMDLWFHGFAAGAAVGVAAGAAGGCAASAATVCID